MPVAACVRAVERFPYKYERIFTVGKKKRTPKAPAIVETGADTITKTRRTGRPSKYNATVASEILTRIACGEALVRICRDDAMPSMTVVYDWLRRHPEFYDLYIVARRDMADTLADELLSIARDEPDVQRARLLVDVRKWICSKLKPKSYGEKVEIEHSGGGDVGITTIRRVIVYPDARREVLAGGQAALPGPAESGD